MHRNVLIASGLIAMAAASGPAFAQSVANYGIGMPAPARGGPLDGGPIGLGAPNVSTSATVSRRPDRQQVEQLIRWGEVGKCVAAKDHEASLSYVAADRGSSKAADAAKRLEPAFDSCFMGAGIQNKGNRGYRRAAIADALGVPLPES